MTAKDFQILMLLEENAQLTHGEIGLTMGMEAEAVAARIKALEESGVLRGTTTIIEWDKIGNGRITAIIELKVSPERDYGYDRIAERISRFKEVRSLKLVTGVYDLQILVTGRSMQEISRFVAERIAPMDRIRETATHLIMKTYKEGGCIFSAHEEHERIPFSL